MTEILEVERDELRRIAKSLGQWCENVSPEDPTPLEALGILYFYLHRLDHHFADAITATYDH